jgi:hypothetical protein
VDGLFLLENGASTYKTDTGNEALENPGLDIARASHDSSGYHDQPTTPHGNQRKGPYSRAPILLLPIPPNRERQEERSQQAEQINRPNNPSGAIHWGMMTFSTEPVKHAQPIAGSRTS